MASYFSSKCNFSVYLRRRRTSLCFVLIVILALLNFLLIKLELHRTGSSGDTTDKQNKAWDMITKEPRVKRAYIEPNKAKKMKSNGVYGGTLAEVRHKPTMSDKHIPLHTTLKKKHSPTKLENTRKNTKGIEKKPISDAEAIINITRLASEALHKLSEEEDLNTCPKYGVTKIDLPYGKCRPHQASKEACALAKELYFLEATLTACKTPPMRDICSIVRSEFPRFTVRCFRGQCLEGNSKRPLLVQSVDPFDGKIVTAKSFYFVEDMELELPRILKKCIQDQFPFLFIKCTRQENHKEHVTQLIPVRAEMLLGQRSSKPRSAHALNVNILLLDSVSRAHFYRSLPKTIALFKEWSESNSAPAEIFDFELFQSVEGHTAENTHALFTGRFLPPHKEEENLPVEMGYLFGRFAGAGYQTMWQEDLCWEALWGLMTDLAVWEWEGLRGEMKNNHIHDTGLTHSSCEMLAQYGLNNPFSGPPGDQICYNGQFQHTYLLNYTLDKLRGISRDAHAQAMLSYMSLSVGHDHVGRRIQTLDPALVQYVTSLAHEQKTITVILADHGNTYTEFASTILEGRFEMFHPHLFVIVPRGVSRILGEEAMAALRANQRRLTTMIDIHHALMALAGPIPKGVRPVGIFGQIPDRTCNDVELRTPNLCVCEGWDSPTTNDTSKLALVEFAIGQLNNKIDRQFLHYNTKDNRALSTLTKSCSRLHPVRFENVRERNSRFGSLITSLDIYVRPFVANGDLDLTSGHAHLDIFHVEVESTESPNLSSMDLRILSYDRVTEFGKFKQCADPGVSLKLCICSVEPRHTVFQSLKSLLNIIHRPWKISDNKVSITTVDRQGCVYLIMRNYTFSFAFEIFNQCADKGYLLLVMTRDSNIKFSTSPPFEINVAPESVTFAFSARKDINYWESSLETRIQVIKIINRRNEPLA
ncbi:predicted protein [Nematostella vectensis]|uniref:Uncharacterized protein n=1 Tax=Nematostella vectensis TaxID=45351 RepID=A7SA85_NEMVE|nr:predicted protein [Nematostella vectensis]|eukprot:XP_001631388.1 predicted protein [Nematostella vectensis]